MDRSPLGWLQSVSYTHLLISAMAANRLVDLTSLVPGMRQCTITVGEKEIADRQLVFDFKMCIRDRQETLQLKLAYPILRH